MTAGARVLSSKTAYREVRAVVLGAPGFIGRWVSRALCERGATVHLVVRDQVTAMSVFRDYAVSGAVLPADLARPGAIERIVEAVRPAIVFNLAGYGVDRSERDAEALHALNTQLVHRLCDALGRLPDEGWAGQRLVHAGSALEYGRASGRLQEDLAPDPTTPYGRAKLAATEHVARAGAATGLRAVTARLFTVYGPGEHEGRLLPTLLGAAAAGGAVELSAGDQPRDFTYVEDVADGLVRLGVAPVRPGAVVNLATGRLTTVRRFAETAASVLGIPPADLHFGAVPFRTDEMFHDAVAIDRLRAMAAWAPPTDIAAGIRRTRDFLEARGLSHA